MNSFKHDLYFWYMFKNLLFPFCKTNEEKHCKNKNNIIQQMYKRLD